MSKEILEVKSDEQAPYKFRRLKATDVFPMVKILKAIGVNKFAACFENSDIKTMITNLSNDEGEQQSNNAIVGAAIVLDLAQIIMDGLEQCEADIYKLLANTSDLSEDEIKSLDMVTFTEMIIDFIKKDDFKDFMKAVSKFNK